MSFKRMIREIPFIELIYSPVLERNAKINYLATCIIAFLFTYVFLNSTFLIALTLLTLGLFFILSLKIAFGVSRIRNKPENDLKILFYYIRFAVYYLIGMAIALMVLSYA